MTEYLEPDVNFEAFDHGKVVMEGVSTSIAGFIGMATRGPVVGKPVLITSMAQYRNVFGSYLNANNPYRYLSYGVEQFFINGGSACYVMRVASSEDVAAIHVIGNDDAKLVVRAKSPGAWGNECDMYFEKESLLRTIILEVADDEKKIVRVENTRSFEVGDL